MADPIRVSGPIGGTDKTLSFETGKFALQSRAVVASIGCSTVLATANAAKDVREGMDFFPLTVDVEERAHAAGKIPGAFFRREGRPSEGAILTCRLTDRPLRPAFAEGYRNETQVVITVLGADQENPHDVLSINAASAAFMLSGIPFDGPSAPSAWPSARTAGGPRTRPTPRATRRRASSSSSPGVVDNGDVAVAMVEAAAPRRASPTTRTAPRRSTKLCSRVASRPRSSTSRT